MATRVARIVRLATRNPRALVGRFKYVLILSHMRAHTSLLAHILGSHPEVSGYFELHRSYRGRLDLLRMRAHVARGLDGLLRGRYVLDKILHSGYQVGARILDREDVFTIFMVRRPLGTLQSCLRMQLFKSQPDAAARYYVERLASLAATAAVSRHRVYLDAEALLEKTEPVLECLRDYLGLRQALSPAYSTFKFTGVREYGDWSDAIMRGAVVKGGVQGKPVEIPADALSQADAAFSAARGTLMKSCRPCG